MDEELTDGVFDAFRVARERGAFATGLDTAGLRKLSAAVRGSAAYTARGTSLVFAQAIKEVVDDITNDNIGESEGIVRLIHALRSLGYTPEGGFPGELAVPPALPGTLQDISSNRRLALIIRTQVDLMIGRGEQMRGHELAAARSFPAWELIRKMPVTVARDWPARWHLAGGTKPHEMYAVRAYQNLYEKTGMIALKGDPVWGELGSSENFSDALDVDYPPFCFNSGMGWWEVSAARCKVLGITGPDGETPEEWIASQPPTLHGKVGVPTHDVPVPVISVRNVAPDLVTHFELETGAVPVAGKPTLLEPPRTADGDLDFSDLSASYHARRKAAQAAQAEARAAAEAARRAKKP